jgi:hypothetical protein
MIRVRVVSGDMNKPLGLGNLVGYPPVFLFRGPRGNLLSNKACEEKPSSELIQEMEEAGAEFVRLPANPKIELDNGDVVYGCQVYWSRVESSDNQT